MANEWKQLFWKVVSHPTFEVAAVVIVVGSALWAMFNSHDIYQTPHIPVLFGYR